MQNSTGRKEYHLLQICYYSKNRVKEVHVCFLLYSPCRIPRALLLTYFIIHFFKSVLDSNFFTSHKYRLHFIGLDAKSHIPAVIYKGNRLLDFTQLLKLSLGNTESPLVCTIEDLMVLLKNVTNAGLFYHF
jgi:hypothetical protein